MFNVLHRGIDTVACLMFYIGYDTFCFFFHIVYICVCPSVYDIQIKLTFAV